MPPKRKTSDEAKPKATKKVKGEDDAAKPAAKGERKKKAKSEDKGDEGTANEENLKTGAMTAEEEKLILIYALAQCQFKLSKACQKEMATMLNRKEKAIDTYWYGKVAKKIKEFQTAKDGSAKASGSKE